MPAAKLFLLTTVTMLAFASNSLLCRQALKDDTIDPASFTALRILSGAVMLVLVIRAGRGVLGAEKSSGHGDWISAFTLLAYAALFSFAYTSLPVGIGALFLFGAVQATMILTGLWVGERLRVAQWLGLALAMGGFVYLVLPGLSAPPWWGASLMTAAGVAWGVYSLRGRSNRNPIAATTSNFVRASPMAIAVWLVFVSQLHMDLAGIVYATVSGAITSGLGYVVWYQALRGLTATSAAIVQLSLPAISSLGGVLLLGEPLTARLIVATIAILSGIAIVIIGKRRVASAALQETGGLQKRL